jgi:uncharacterized coiled-coil protein SlyX
MMAEPTKADLGEKIDKLAEAVDALAKEFKDFREAEFNGFKEMSQRYFAVLDVVKWIAGVFALAIIGAIIGGAIQTSATIAAMNTTIGHHEKAFERSAKELADLKIASTKDFADLKIAITAQDREIAKEFAKQGRDIGRLEGAIETLVKENKKLAVLIEKKNLHFANIKTFHGTMLSVKGDELQFMSRDKIQLTFRIRKDTRILVNGKEADLDELYGLKFVPVHIYLSEHDPYAIMIEAEKSKLK